MRLGGAALLIACTAIAGCASPEARRTRGGGPGGDPGNRRETVKVHEGSQPYWKTPDRIGGAHGPMESARHAQRGSR